MGGGEPQKNVDVRTMASDLNSIQSGGAPQSYTPQTPMPPPAPSQAPSAAPDNFNFEIPQVPTGMDQVAGNSAPQVPTGKKKGKGALIGLITFIVVLALGAVGYFLVYPMFAGTKPPAETVTTGGAVTTPTTTETTGTSVAVTTTGTSTNASSSQTTTSSTTTTTPQAPLAHTSLFAATDGSINSASPISGANLANLSLGTSKEPALVEVTFTDQNGNSIPFSTLMQSLLSMDLSNSGLTQAFDPASVSGFVYVDSSGARWLGFAAKLTATSSLVDEKASFAQIFEANTNLKNFFAADPGTEGAWKSGDAATSNRYVLFSKNGYGLDYGWKGDVLVIASSYDGYKAAIQDLQ